MEYLQSNLLEAVMSGGVDRSNHCNVSDLQNFNTINSPVRHLWALLCCHCHVEQWQDYS